MKFADQQAAIADAVATFPATFGLRAFPGQTFRLAPQHVHFFSDGEMQLVVQRQITPAEQRKRALPEWADHSRGTLDELYRLLVLTERV